MFGKKKPIKQAPPPSLSGREYDRFMGRVYKLVGCHRDSDAVHMLLDEYDYLKTPIPELEALHAHVTQWGASRTLLCLGRLIIYRLDREKRHAQALGYIEKCQDISPRFIMPELTRVTFYARQAVAAGRLDIAKNLVVDHDTRYAGLVGSGECERLLQLIEPDIDLDAISYRRDQ